LSADAVEQTAYMLVCDRCGRLWRHHPRRYLVPCCNETPRGIGPTHDPVQWRPNASKDPLSGARERIAQWIKGAGAVSWENVAYAESQGWLTVVRSVWWPYKEA
jgi:hypothetical protein